MSENEYKHQCEENDNIIRVVFVDGIIDEYHFSDALDTERIVIGVGDLSNASEAARQFMKEEESKSNVAAIGSDGFGNHAYPEVTRSVRCNICEHEFTSKAQIKNIRCPNCGSNQSLSVRD